MQRLARSPEAGAADDKAKADADGKATPTERKIAELKKSPAFFDKNHKDYADVMRQYRAGLERGEEFDLHEGDALAFLARSGADADTVRGLYGDFHEAAGNGGGVLDDAAVARLEKKWAPRIGAEAVATLKRWYVEQVREARREPCPASRYRRTRRRCCALCGRRLVRRARRRPTRRAGRASTTR